MLKLLATIFGKKPAAPGTGKSAGGQDPADDDGPIFEGLAMTDELREALFPTRPQMVSAIFDRPPPLDRRPAPAPAAPEPSGDSSFPIIF